MKKIISMVLCIGLLLSATLCAQAAVTPNYSLTSNYSTTTQGANGWYYQYRDGGTYSDYKDLTKETEGTRWVVYTASGAVQNFVTAIGEMQAKGSTVDNKTAFVWKAPYSGKINLTANGNVRMVYNSGQKAPIEAGIAHTNSNYELVDYQNEYDSDTVKTNDNYIWWYSIPANDKVGIEPYNIDIEVSAGDMLFFEMGSITATAATMVWDPVIKYLQAAQYTAGGAGVTEIKDIDEGSAVSIELYNDTPLSASVYFMVYDALNRLRDIDIVTGSETSGSRINTVLTMPAFDANEAETSYEGWKIKTFAITNSIDRFYPVNISDKLILN